LIQEVWEITCRVREITQAVRDFTHGRIWLAIANCMSSET